MRIAPYSPLLAPGALLLLIWPAQAIEPEAAAQALTTALAAGSRVAISFESAASSGADVVVSGLSATDGHGEDTITFETVTIAAPTEGGDGVFASPSITFSGGAIAGKAKGTIGSATLTDAIVLDPQAVPNDAAPTPAQGLLFKTAEIADIVVTPEGRQEPATIAKIAVEVEKVVDNVPLDSKGTITDMKIPASAFAGRPMGPATLGYGDLVLDVTWDASRSPDGKSVDLRDFTVSVEDAAKISITGQFANMPAPTVLNDAGAKSSAREIVVDTMTIRFEDASLTGRILDLQAQKQGVTREAYAGQIGAALPFLLASLNNPAFQQKVATALADFLKDPQSLTVTLAPGEPISGGDILRLARSSPQDLPDRLNAEIDANAAN